MKRKRKCPDEPNLKFLEMGLETRQCSCGGQAILTDFILFQGAAVLVSKCLNPKCGKKTKEIFKLNLLSSSTV